MAIKTEDNSLHQMLVGSSQREEGFKMPNAEPFGYVFLVPRDANSSSLVECLDFGDDWKAVQDAHDEADFASIEYITGTYGVTYDGGLFVRYPSEKFEPTIVRNECYYGVPKQEPYSPTNEIDGVPAHFTLTNAPICHLMYIDEFEDGTKVTNQAVDKRY